ncbi:Fic family protein [Desulfovibrio sp. JC010]|uniref:Fic family protein n=1 Tax=Desulfovibrio sp. JC010 TaxID=2593641 RepID=UPI0013D7158E|nr:Fic family protein [Desulfovibrio sp. JC010]NDV27636.1 Fic family protein [Desulfovibrio sp. JC010]
MRPDKKKALFVARKIFTELVFDTQKLEGMPFTFPEVQTFIQGITVGGHKISDAEKLRQQVLGWEALLGLAESGKFELSKNIACELQAVIAKDEALEIGRFRSGKVGIAGTDYCPPKPEELDGVFQKVMETVAAEESIPVQGYLLHLLFARSQFFYDGNKRTGLLMMNGHLLSNGYPPMSIPAKFLAEYNTGMIEFYESGDPADMLVFIKRCHEKLAAKFEF